MRSFAVNIFLRELKANLKSLVIWCIITALLIIIAVAKFSAFIGDTSMLAIIDSMPKPFLDAFNLRAFNLTTLTGFYGLMFIYFSLMGAIAAAMWGSDMISKEECDKTVEFSLVLPVSRSRVVTAKVLAAFVDCILLALDSWGVSYLAVQQFNPDAAFYSFLRLEILALFIIVLIFLAVGVLLGCALKQYRRSGAIAVGIILGTYFISVISGLQKNPEWMKWLSPFKYFDSFSLLNTGHLYPGFTLLSLGIIAVCVVLAYVIYERRDLYI